jgi:putative peptide zinc metalloprotease protein
MEGQMHTAESTQHRERRKQVRLRLRRDLAIAPVVLDGQQVHVVKDPISLRYWHFREPDYFLLQQLDGQATLEEARERFETEFRPERLSLEEVESFARHLLTSGIAESDSAEAGEMLLEQRRKYYRDKRLNRLTNVLNIQFPVFDPDRLLARMLRYIGWIVTPLFGLVCLAVVLAALALVATHFEQFRARLPAYHEFFSPANLVSMWLMLGIVKIIHEFGHGLTCKAFGGEVHEMGVLFLCFSPSLYCNVSDAWVMPNKWKRILISAAGIIVELVVAALATFVWWNTTGSYLIHQISLSLMVVCSVSTVLFNGNPLMRYDGYYVLSDWLEIPNLASRSGQFLLRLFQRYALGIRVTEEPYLTPGRKVLFVAYAIGSFVYRWVVVFGIIWFFYQVLKPYKLGAVGSLLAVMALGQLLAGPVRGLIHVFQKRGRLPDMKRSRVALSSMIVLVLIALFFLLPIPISRVRQVGLVQFDPESAEAVHVSVPGLGERVGGVLDKLHVRDGEHVEEGRVLAEFRHREIDEGVNETQGQLGVEEARRSAALDRLRASTDEAERNKLRSEAARASGECERLAGRLGAYQAMQASLVLRAPRAGVVFGLPRPDEVGRQWDRQRSQPFCRIGDAGKLRVLVPVSPADYRLLRDDTAAARRHSHTLAVDVRVQGHAGRTWQGHLSELPPAEAREVPAGLTQRSGGPLAVKTGAATHALVPQEQQYLVPISIESPSRSVCPGARAQVKIHCRWRPAAWWAWRTLASAFDLPI